MEIVLTPSPLERRAYSKEHDALIRALGEGGFAVKVEAPVEYRDSLVHEVADVTIQLLGDAEHAARAYAVSRLVEAVLVNLVRRRERRNDRRDRPHVEILDHRGEPLARVELPVDDEDYGSAA